MSKFTGWRAINVNPNQTLRPVVSSHCLHYLRMPTVLIGTLITILIIKLEQYGLLLLDVSYKLLYYQVMIYTICSYQKHAHSNILTTLPPKKCQFSEKKKIWYFSYSALNIDCGHRLEPPRRGGSNEYPQSMFLSRNKKTNVYPCKPQFYYIKVGFKGVQIRLVFVMQSCLSQYF